MLPIPFERRNRVIPMSDDEYLNVEASAEEGAGPVVGALLRSVGETLESAPQDYLYNLKIEVDEIRPEEDDE